MCMWGVLYFEGCQRGGWSKMIDINYTLFIQMANFLIFLVLMNFVLYRPIRRVVAERNRLISEKQGEIELLETQARASLLEYDRLLQESRARVFRRCRNSRPLAMSRRRNFCGDFGEGGRKSSGIARKDSKRDWDRSNGVEAAGEGFFGRSGAKDSGEEDLNAFESKGKDD